MTSAFRRSLQGISLSVLVEARRTFDGCFDGQRGKFAVALGLALGSTAVELLKPWPTKVLFDRVIDTSGSTPGWLGLGPLASAAALGALIVVLATVGGALTLRSTIMIAEVGRKVTVRIRQRLFEHLHRLDLPFHTSARSGDLIVRLTGDVALARDALINTWLSLVDNGALMLGMGVVLVLLDPMMALCALAPLPLLGLHLNRSNRELRTTTRQQRRREGSATAYALESLRQFRVVKAYSREDSTAAQYGKMTGQGEKAGVKATRIVARMSFSTDVLSGIGLGLVVLVGSQRVLSGSLSPGDLLVATTYSRNLFRPLRRVSRDGGRLSKATTGTERILEVMRVQPTESQGGLDATGALGEITFDGVRSTYDGEVEALRGLSFTVPAGSLAVVEGANGSGKSTMLAVLLRLTPADDGQVLLDGVPIDDYELGSYRSLFAYVPQEIHLFGATVRENILFGDPSASDDEIVAAAQLAHFDEVVDQLSDGYNTVLGEGGASLSGGQARRLMIARAALRDSRILILDEPLTGLDPLAREQVANSVRSVTTGRTAIVVNHLGSEIFDPDVVLQVAHGLLAEKIVFHKRDYSGFLPESTADGRRGDGHAAH